MSKNRKRKITGSISALLIGTVFICGASMDAEASAALGSSAGIGISADLEAVEDTEVLEDAMNDVVLDAFHLDSYSNLGIVTVSEGDRKSVV